MSKSKSKSKSKLRTGFGSRSAAKPGPKPVMMIQIFAQTPYVLARGDTRKLPDRPVIDAFLTEVTILARRMLVPAPNDPTPVDDLGCDPVPDEIRVSGVPYRVPRPQSRSEPELQSQSQSQSQPEDPTHG